MNQRKAGLLGFSGWCEDVETDAVGLASADVSPEVAGRARADKTADYWRGYNDARVGKYDSPWFFGVDDYKVGWADGYYSRITPFDEIMK